MKYLLTLDDLDRMVDWSRNTAIIGDGPSKCRYFYDPRKVNVFCINKAILKYPGDMTVTVSVHREEILELLPDNKFLIEITNKDIKNRPITLFGGVINHFLDYVGMKIHPGRKIYLQGNDMTGGRDWTQYIEGFMLWKKKYRNKQVEVIATAPNEKVPWFAVGYPDPSELSIGNPQNS